MERATNRTRRCRSSLPRANSGQCSSRNRALTASSVPCLLTSKELRSKIYLEDTRLYRPKHAYFTLLLNEDCLPAALLLGWTLRRSGTKNDIVVMVTASVGRRNRGRLKMVFDRVVDVDIMQIKGSKGSSKYEREREMYAQRMTKCNLFQFIEYEKILYVEISIYVERNIDELFELEAPAGISSLVSITGQDKWHGLHLPRDHVTKALHLSRGIRGCLMLLTPSINVYHYCHSSNNHSHIKTGFQFIYPDEEFITKLFINSWTHIHAKFSLVPWQVHRVSKDVYGICLESFQPWADSCKESREVFQWRLKVLDMLTDIPRSRVIFKNQRWFIELELCMHKGPKTGSFQSLENVSQIHG